MRHFLIHLCAGALLVLGATDAAHAQDRSKLLEEMKKRVNEIAELMRKSESAFLGLTTSDRLTSRQRQIARKLAELNDKQPPRNASAAERKKIEEARKQEKDKLQEEQRQIRRKLREMLDGSQNRATQIVRSLEELLRKMPRRSSNMPDPNQDQNKPKPNKSEREEKKQKSPSERKKENQRKKLDNRKPKDDIGERALREQIEAWVARFPPEEQERLRRGDYSRIPMRYREYVRQIFKRRAEKDVDDSDKR